MTDATMVCEAMLKLSRVGDMSDVIVAIDYQYEFSEEALVRAIARHPQSDVILNSNPNGKPTEAALAHAEEAGVSLFSLRELMGALNYDGRWFREYTPPDPHR